MHILYVESQDDKAVLVTDKLGSRSCRVTRAKGLIEAAGLVGLRDFDLVLISDVGRLAPVSALIERLRKKELPYAYLVPKRDRMRVNHPNVTVEELDNGVLDQLAHAGA